MLLIKLLSAALSIVVTSDRRLRGVAGVGENGAPLPSSPPTPAPLMLPVPLPEGVLGVFRPPEPLLLLPFSPPSSPDPDPPAPAPRKGAPKFVDSFILLNVASAAKSSSSSPPSLFPSIPTSPPSCRWSADKLAPSPCCCSSFNRCCCCSFSPSSRTRPDEFRLSSPPSVPSSPFPSSSSPPPPEYSSPAIFLKDG